MTHRIRRQNRVFREQLRGSWAARNQGELIREDSDALAEWIWKEYLEVGLPLATVAPAFERWTRARYGVALSLHYVRWQLVEAGKTPRLIRSHRKIR